MAASVILNFNVGVLGHVDSGKTSLVKALSTVASTAAFDKNPQSAQIIDLMMLVVDVTKGMQTQTAECLVIGEITCDKMIVVLNKVDMLPEAKRAAAIEKMSKRLLKTLETTRFVNSPIVSVAARPGGPEGQGTEVIDVDKLIEALKQNTYKPNRSPQGTFIYAVDHCFSIKGVGTVMTGTVHHGSVSVGDTVEIPSMKISKKVKSIQMFKQPVEKAIQGDRVGICVTQFDPKLLERGLVCSPGALPTISAAIISVKKIPYFKGNVMTKAKFHITMGHDTAMGRVSFFGCEEETPETASMDYSREYKYQDEFIMTDKKDGATEDNYFPKRQYALIELERPLTCAPNCLVIGSRLDTDIHANVCRIAFHGQMLEAITDIKYRETVLPKLKVFKNKSREGLVERVTDEYTIIGKALFKKETNLNAFVGLKVSLSSGEQGVIEGGFGQSGKFKVRVPNGLQPTTVQRYAGKKKGKKGKDTGAEEEPPAAEGQEAIKIFLNFKRFIYDPKKQMFQT
ncbi:selenocysteine-specific elongation factor-like isoform X2 [Lineus longissimus]|uniref:selenocysteine-specific elongation factor-like isoform X2 n=1 Tax=Lineus longissimus TaxID=88925 RepID=UPI00315D30D1